MLNRRMGILLMCITIALSVYANDTETVGLKKISNRVWIHTSYQMINGYATGSNGILIDCNTGIVMIDTCWNDAQTNTLLSKIRTGLKKRVLLAIITHSHADRIGGIRALRNAGIKVIASELTSQMAADAGYPAPTPELKDTEHKLTAGDTDIVTYFPGPGHTKDNIVVWIAGEKVLFGGCLIKSLETGNLGNIADADTEQWPSSIEKILEKYPAVKIVVPGHGAAGTKELLTHTLDLCRQR